MDQKRFVLALTLSMLILFLYPIFLQKFYPAKMASVEQPAETVQTTAQTVPVPAPEVSVPEEKQEEAEKIPFENETYSATFTSAGGGISSLSLKAFATGRVQGNFLVEEDPGLPAAFSVRTFENGVWREGIYKPEQPGSLVLVREEAGNFRIRKQFSFLPSQYLFTVDVTIENLKTTPQSVPYEIIAPLFIGDSPPSERPEIELDYVLNGEIDVKPADKIMKTGHLVHGSPEWVALEKKYFTLIVKPETPLEHVRSSFQERSLIHYLKAMSMEIPAGGSISHRYLVFAGPKQIEAMKETGFGFEKILHTKYLGALWIYFLMMLKFFYKLTHNYGVAIILLSSAIKLVFAPLTHMSFESMRKMQALQPKLKALQEQYKNDPQKLNQEVMELYKRNKVNPFGGCLPLLLQMPIFIALYRTFSSAIELRGAPFYGWIKDLAEPDQLFLLPFSLPLLGNQVNILPIIMIGTMLWQQKLTPQTAASKDQEMMMLLMPIVFGFIFYHLPSGLVIYWIVNNILTIAHQLFMKKFHILPESA